MRIDRSLQTDARAEPARPEAGAGKRRLARFLRRRSQEARRDPANGPFSWRDVPDDRREAWARVFRVEGTTARLDGPCPACGERSLRRYFRAHDSGDPPSGGAWEWCGSCFAFTHARVTVPAWWAGDRRLDQVPFELLEETPEPLERALRASGDSLPRSVGE